MYDTRAAQRWVTIAISLAAIQTTQVACSGTEEDCAASAACVAAAGGGAASAGAAGANSGRAGASGSAGTGAAAWGSISFRDTSPFARVAPGSSAAFSFEIERSGEFRGPVIAELSDLPAGVTASPVTIASSATKATFEISALPSAPVGGPTLARLTARAQDNASLTEEMNFELYIAGEPGVRDISFGLDGAATHKATDYQYDEPYDVSIDARGRIWLVGEAQGTEPWVGWIMRLDESGMLDATFGDSGRITGLNALGSSVNSVEAIGTSALVAINRPNTSGFTGFLRMFGDAGSVDTSFGTGGDVIFADGVRTILRSGDSWIVRSRSGNQYSHVDSLGSVKRTFSEPADLPAPMVQVDAKGRLVLALAADGPGPHRLARLSQDGSMDGTFGTAGVAAYPVRSGHVNAYPISLMVAPGGDLVLFAQSKPSTADSVNQEAFLVRFNDSGAVVSSFGNSGSIVVTLVGYGAHAFMQNDGKIVAIHADFVAGASRCAIVRCDGNGALDRSFGENGRTILGGDVTV